VERGYVEKTKVGRRNHYNVVREAHLRLPQVSRITLGAFLDLMAATAPAAARRSSKT
jgi:hypothetical protein